MNNNDSQLLTETLHSHGLAIEKAVHSNDEIKIAETLKNISKDVLEKLCHHNMGFSGNEHKAIKHIKKELASRSTSKKITKESVNINEISHEKVRAYLAKARDSLFYAKEKKSMDPMNDSSKRFKRNAIQKRVTDQIIKNRSSGIDRASKKVND